MTLLEQRSISESLTSDHPSYTTTPMWFWGWSYKRGSTVFNFQLAENQNDVQHHMVLRRRFHPCRYEFTTSTLVCDESSRTPLTTTLRITLVWSYKRDGRHWSLVRDSYTNRNHWLSVTRNVVVWEGWSLTLVRVVVRQGFYCTPNNNHFFDVPHSPQAQSDTLVSQKSGHVSLSQWHVCLWLWVCHCHWHCRVVHDHDACFNFRQFHNVSRLHDLFYPIFSASSMWLGVGGVTGFPFRFIVNFDVQENSCR